MDISKDALLKGMVFSLLSAFSIGTLGILGRLGFAAGMSEFAILQNRWMLGALILFIYLALTDARSLCIDRRTLLKAAVLGAGFQFLAGFTYFKAIGFIPLATTTLIIYFYPVMVTLGAAVFYKLPLRAEVVSALFIIVAGVLLVFFDALRAEMNLTGVLYAGANMVIFSGYLLAAQSFLRGQNPLVLTFYMALAAGLAFSLFHSPLSILQATAQELFIGLLLGLIPTAVSYVFSFLAIKKAGSAYLAIFSTFELVTVLVLANVILGEGIHIYQVGGMALIMAGIALPQLRRGR